MKTYDIFISYRHCYTADKAEHLLTLLEDNGFRGRVSFDRDNLNSRFDIEILRRIDACTDFVIVLSEHTFDNIIFEDWKKYQLLAASSVDEFESLQNELFPDTDSQTQMDYTRLELARAIYNKKNIVPIAPLKSVTYSFEGLSLPQDIKVMTKYHAAFYDDAGSMTFHDIVERKVLGKNTLLKSKPQKSRFTAASAIKLFIFILILLVSGSLFYIWFKDYSTYNRCSNLSQYDEYIFQTHIFYNQKVVNDKELLSGMLEFKEVPDGLRERLIESDLTKINVSQAKSLSSILMNMVFVEGGEFIMGADSITITGIVDPDVSIQEMPAHQVSVDDFYINKYELSVEEWNGIMGISDTDFSIDEKTLPLTNVSWQHVQTFIDELNDLLDLGFRLPLEKEWEYAAGGGFHSEQFKYSGSNDPLKVAWTSLDSLSSPMPRHRDGIAWWKDSNALGLFNMSGNVAEFCQDKYYLYNNPERDYRDNIIVKGGSYDMSARHSRITARDRASHSEENGSIGFRLVMDAVNK